MADPTIDVKITADIASLTNGLSRAESAVRSSTDAMSKSASRLTLGKRVLSDLAAYENALKRTAASLKQISQMAREETLSQGQIISIISMGLMQMKNKYALIVGIIGMITGEIMAYNEAQQKGADLAAKHAAEIRMAFALESERLTSLIKLEQTKDEYKKAQIRHEMELAEIRKQYQADAERLGLTEAQSLSHQREFLANERLKAELADILLQQQEEQKDLQEEAKKLAQEAAEAAAEQARQKEEQAKAAREAERNAHDMVAAAKKELEIARETDPVRKRELQYELEKMRIYQEFWHLREQIGFEAAFELINKREEVAEQQKLNDLLAIQAQLQQDAADAMERARMAMPSGFGQVTTSLGGTFSYTRAMISALSSMASGMAGAGGIGGVGGVGGAGSGDDLSEAANRMSGDVNTVANRMGQAVNYMSSTSNAMQTMTALQRDTVMAIRDMVGLIRNTPQVIA